MAANKFASIVHKHTNRFTLILIYTLLEWTLIILLLLNSLFTHFTIKFAQFFSLKPPCSWCIQFTTNPHQDLCHHHSKQVSDLGFCSQHLKLANFNDMCSDCNKDSKLGFDDQNLNLKCSCCGVEFKRNGFRDLDYFVINPSWEVLGFPKSVGFGENQETEETGEKTEDLIQIEKEEGVKLETLTQDLEFLLDYSGNQLVPVELIEPVVDNLEQDDLVVDEDQEFGEFQKAQDVSGSKIEIVTDELELLQENQETHCVLQDVKTDESSKFIELDSMEFEETENSLVFHANSSDYSNEKPAVSEPVQQTEESDSDKVEAEVPIDTKDIQETEECNSENEEAEVSIGTEIPVLDTCDEIKAQDNFNLYNLSHEEEEEASSNSHDLDFNIEYGFQETQEDEKTEDTILIIERKDSMVDESCDGSEMDGGDPINTTEKLKSALRAERKALQALYTELEEERSASAVAASETMAMINRLHEEKAAMQMEALHYQRMMEEQSEYDLEALQLLNELMMKKEKELEVYRKKVLDYETKEKVRFLTSRTSSAKSNTCSASCSHSEDGDGMWVDVNHELKEEGIRNGNQEITNVDSSFVDFEDERLSILEQLKVLEEKLFTLSDEEDRHFDYFNENGKHVNGTHGYDGQYGQDGQEVNGVDSRYQDRRVIGSTGKRLLPLFDATETESDEGAVVSNGNGNGFHSEVENVAVTRFELQKKRIDIEEEVDQLYVRLQALEADREFLKHCIGSLKKGDKGMELLQEILQHLRDLKHVDLREKSFADGTLV